MRSGSLLVAGAAMVALVVSGCSEDGEAEPSDPDSSSAGASVTPAPTPVGPVEPTLPPEARGADAAAAEAFVRHYWAMTEYAQLSGDVIRLRDLALDGCTACQSGVEFVIKAHRDGGRFSGGRTFVSGLTATEVRYGQTSAFQVRGRLRTTDQTVDYPGSRPRESFPGGVTRLNTIVEHRDGAWRVAFWEIS